MENNRRNLLQEIVGGAYELEHLSELAIDALYSFQSAYNCSPIALLRGAQRQPDLVDLTEKGYFLTLDSLFSNPFVRDRLLSAQRTIFSRRHKKKDPDQLFQEALCAIAEEVAKTHGNETADYYREMAPLSELSARLQGYIREKPTRTSREACQKLKKVLDGYKLNLEQTQMTVHLLGSCRYGDAAPSSDIDVNYIVLAEEESLEALRDSLIENIEGEIEDSDGEAQKINVGMYHAIIKDILDRETKEVSDYEYGESLFHPYDWLLQGMDLSTGKNLHAEIEEVQAQLLRAAAQDPFFEFLLSFSMIESIQKRKENISRK